MSDERAADRARLAVVGDAQRSAPAADATTAADRKPRPPARRCFADVKPAVAQVHVGPGSWGSGGTDWLDVCENHAAIHRAYGHDVRDL